MRRRAVTFVLLSVTLSACQTDGPSPADSGVDVSGDAGCIGATCRALQPLFGEPETIVPGDELPAEIVVQDSNNNLDVVRHDGGLFLAFRTGPSHFASPEVQLHVVRSDDDGESWVFETTVDRDTDLREPRFLSLGDRLFVYFAVLGEAAIGFEPQGTMVTERLPSGEWTEPEWIFETGFIPWRIHLFDDVPYLLGYVGGENIYEVDGEPVEVYWLTTRDGRDWQPVVAGQPIVLVGGSSETDLTFLDDGGIVAVSRNEAGDELGFGMKICRAEANDLGRWTCVADPRKYDSPLVFRHGQRVFLIGRRNLTETGFFDLGYDNLNRAQQYLQYQLDYSNRPKRCSLWEVDPESLKVRFLVDLPSRGDTCFASILEEGPNAYSVFNYTSPLDGPDVAWQRGQAGQTLIYRVDLTFADPNE